jgi:hypothetical protein
MWSLWLWLLVLWWVSLPLYIVLSLVRLLLLRRLHWQFLRAG